MRQFNPRAPYAQFTRPRGGVTYVQDGAFFSQLEKEVPPADVPRDVLEQFRPDLLDGAPLPVAEPVSAHEVAGEWPAPDIDSLGWAALKAEYKRVFGKGPVPAMNRDQIVAALREHGE